MLFPKEPGMHAMLLQGPDGTIQVSLSIPDDVQWDKVALVGHPHPLHDGTMDNKVVTTTGRAILALNIPVIRVNLRGVGQSTGQFANGLGEAQDMLWILQQWRHQFPQSKIYLSGFSFGSYVAFQVAQQIDVECLILIAPPVARFNFDLAKMKRFPDVVFQGDMDEVVAADVVEKFTKKFVPTIPMEWFAETGHFFHGKLVQLKDAVQKWILLCSN